MNQDGVRFEDPELEYILACINNYDGMGPPRDAILRKIRDAIGPEATARIRKLHGHTWDAVYRERERDLLEERRQVEDPSSRV